MLWKTTARCTTTKSSATSWLNFGQLNLLFGEKTNTDDFIENTKIVAEKTGSLMMIWVKCSVMMMESDKTLPLWMTTDEED